MPDLQDKDFVALARKVGYPDADQLKKCRAVQVERAKKGEKASLFAWAKAQGFLTKGQVSRFERWADQIARKADEPIEEEESTDDAQPEKPKKLKKRIHDSAAYFSVEAPKCPACGGELDSVAVMEGRAREVEGRIECVACAEAAAAKPQAKKKRKKISQALVDSASFVVNKIKRKRPAETAARPASSSSSMILIAVGASVVGALVVVAVIVANQGGGPQPDPSPKVVTGPKVEPKNDPVAKPKVDEPSKPKVDEPAKPAFDASAAIADAERVEREEREAEALSLLELALGRAREAADRDLVAGAKLKMLSRLSDRLASEKTEAQRLASAGDESGARDRVAKLRKRFPRSLDKELAAIEKTIDAAAAERKERELAEKKEQEARAKRREAIDAYAATRTAIDKALAALDVDKAKAALAGAAESSEPAVADERKLDARKIDAIAKLVQFASEGYKLEAGRPIELEMRSGPTVKGKLLRVEGDKLSVEAMGGEIAVAMADLAARPFLLTARRGAKKNTDEYLFARGVLLASLGDTKAAIEALEGAATIPEAEQLVKELKEKGSPSTPDAPAPAPKKEKNEKPDEPTPPANPASNDDDQRIAKALAQKLKVRATVQAGEASYSYDFMGEDQLLDWKAEGYDVIQTGNHEILARASQNGLLLGASSRETGVLTHCLRMKGDVEIEVRMMFNQMSPSAQFVVFFGEKNGKSIGASFGQQLVRVSAGGVKPLAGAEPDRARWASEKLCTFRIVKKGDQVEITMNGIKCAAGKLAKGEGDGKIGIAASGIRAIVDSIKVKGVVDPSQL